MRVIDRIYIGGEFVQPHGTELFDLHNPATGKVIGRVKLGDEEDARRAITAARQAFPSFSRTSKEDRLAMLRKLSDVVARNADALTEAAVKEYGGPVTAMVQWVKYASQGFLEMAEALERFEFTRRIKSAEVVMEPIGVVGMITPWNANVLLVTNKLATAIAAGCTAVVKPSEMSALQTQVLTEALHEAGLPPGVFNIVNGRGDVVGAELSSHPDIAKVSFTGSSVVGKANNAPSGSSARPLMPHSAFGRQRPTGSAAWYSEVNRCK